MRAQSAVNRALLASIGTVLFGAGLLALAGALDLYRRWDLPRPTRWLPTTPHDALDRAVRHGGFSTWAWAWPVTLTALTLVSLLALVWLLRQLPSATTRKTPLGGTVLRGRIMMRGTALAQAIQEEILDVSGVQRARVRVAGSDSHPSLYITVALDATGSPREVLHALQSGPIDHARMATGWTHLPVDIRFSNSPHRARRTH